MTALNETMELLTPELRQEVFDFAKYLVRKHSKRKSKIGNSKERIMKLAGAWKDMDEKDFQNFIDDIYGRREKSFSERLTNNTRHFSRIKALEIANWSV